MHVSIRDVDKIITAYDSTENSFPNVSGWYRKAFCGVRFILGHAGFRLGTGGGGALNCASGGITSQGQ
jgi:hypothetical protein